MNNDEIILFSDTWSKHFKDLISNMSFLDETDKEHILSAHGVARGLASIDMAKRIVSRGKP